jgi:mono/diheme cytochrome c family protein
LLLAVLTIGPAIAHADDAPVDPFLGQPAAIEEGQQQYRAKCIICHGKAGGRGPNLFATKLRDDQFLATVMSGRPGTLMPAFGLRLAPDDIWKILAFLKAHPGGM